jgi:hypothetical protein
MDQMTSTLEARLAELSADKRSCVTPPLEPWFSDSRGDELIVDAASVIMAVEDFQTIIDKASDALNEDGSRLLRNAQQAINKASGNIV